MIFPYVNKDAIARVCNIYVYSQVNIINHNKVLSGYLSAKDLKNLQDQKLVLNPSGKYFDKHKYSPKLFHNRNIKILNN